MLILPTSSPARFKRPDRGLISVPHIFYSRRIHPSPANPSVTIYHYVIYDPAQIHHSRLICFCSNWCIRIGQKPKKPIQISTLRCFEHWFNQAKAMNEQRLVNGDNLKQSRVEYRWSLTALVPFPIVLFPRESQGLGNKPWWGRSCHQDFQTQYSGI